MGWSVFFADQLEAGEDDLSPRRIASVHRSRLSALSSTGATEVGLPARSSTGDFAVGDWVLADPQSNLLRRRLERRTVLQRHSATGLQLAAANVDTLFIVTSCNADFNPARLERYLALANQAGTTPVVLLTKADTTADAGLYREQAEALQRDLPVIILNPRTPDAIVALRSWCGAGQTVALVGSSGVGKSTLVNSLAGPRQDLPQLTGDIRASDAKGRHTTTGRSLHAIAGGGWVIDTPGMRSLQVTEVDFGIDLLFAEITELVPHCRFRDCTHTHEPGCAVQAAIAAGTLDRDRLDRWRKLQGESRGNVGSKPSARSGATPGRRKH